MSQQKQRKSLLFSLFLSLPLGTMKRLPKKISKIHLALGVWHWDTLKYFPSLSLSFSLYLVFISLCFIFLKINYSFSLCFSLLPSFSFLYLCLLYFLLLSLSSSVQQNHYLIRTPRWRPAFLLELWLGLVCFWVLNRTGAHSLHCRGDLRQAGEWEINTGIKVPKGAARPLALKLLPLASSKAPQG